MGRFASTVEFYQRYREPYPPEFFQTVAERLNLHGERALLDVGCGPGPLAIGFAPFVAACTAVDPEPGMVEAAAAAAERAGVRLSLFAGRLEDIAAAEVFDIVTIGRALHWLDRPAALDVLERIVSPEGMVLICGSTSVDTPGTPWLKPYQEVCRSWSEDPERRRYRVRATDWFAGSAFREAGTISVPATHSVTVADLIGRALSKSNTSPAILGDRQAEFQSAIRNAVEPFLENGVLREEIQASAAVFRR